MPSSRVYHQYLCVPKCRCWYACRACQIVIETGRVDTVSIEWAALYQVLYMGLVQRCPVHWSIVHVWCCLTNNWLNQMVYGSVERSVYLDGCLFSHDQFRFMADCPLNDSLTSSRTLQHNSVVSAHCGLIFRCASLESSRFWLILVNLTLVADV